MWEKMGEKCNMNWGMTNTYIAFDEICDRKSNMGDLSNDARIILKWIFKQVGTGWIQLVQDRVQYTKHCPFAKCWVMYDGCPQSAYRKVILLMTMSGLLKC
jgi:hypothetical protein